MRFVLNNQFYHFSAAYLREHCRRNELYMIPKYNDVLYLHFKVAIQEKLFEDRTKNYKKYRTTVIAGAL